MNQPDHTAAVHLTRNQLAALLAHHADVLAANLRTDGTTGLPENSAGIKRAAELLDLHAEHLTAETECAPITELLDSILTFPAYREAWLTGAAQAEPVAQSPADRAVLLLKRVREYLEARLDCVAVDPTEVYNLLADPPLSPYYEHPECGFAWHGRDGMDIPMRNGQPVCPRCELRRLAGEQPTQDEARRCPSCDHKGEFHHVDGRCWFTVDHGVPETNLACPCAPRRGDAARKRSSSPPRTRRRRPPCESVTAPHGTPSPPPNRPPASQPSRSPTQRHPRTEPARDHPRRRHPVHHHHQPGHHHRAGPRRRARRRALHRRLRHRPPHRPRRPHRTPRRPPGIPPAARPLLGPHRALRLRRSRMTARDSALALALALALGIVLAPFISAVRNDTTRNSP